MENTALLLRRAAIISNNRKVRWGRGGGGRREVLATQFFAERFVAGSPRSSGERLAACLCIRPQRERMGATGCLRDGIRSRWGSTRTINSSKDERLSEGTGRKKGREGRRYNVSSTLTSTGLKLSRASLQSDRK